jgi:hypothetical protein
MVRMTRELEEMGEKTGAEQNTYLHSPAVLYNGVVVQISIGKVGTPCYNPRNRFKDTRKAMPMVS